MSRILIMSILLHLLYMILLITSVAAKDLLLVISSSLQTIIVESVWRFGIAIHQAADAMLLITIVAASYS